MAKGKKKTDVSGNKITKLCREVIEKQEIGSEGGYEPVFRSNLDLIDYLNGRYEANGRIALGFNGGKILTIIGKSGSGKAQPLYSAIQTPDGETIMGNIKVGSIIYDEEGNDATVKEIFPQGILDNYKVIFSDGTFMECNDEHLFSIIRESVSFDEIKKGDVIQSVYDGNISYISDIYYKEDGTTIDYVVTSKGNTIENSDKIIFTKLYEKDNYNEHKVISLKEIMNKGIYVNEITSTFRYEIPMFTPNDIEKPLTENRRNHIQYNFFTCYNYYDNHQLLFTTNDNSLRIFRYDKDKYLLSIKLNNAIYFKNSNTDKVVCNINNDIIFDSLNELKDYLSEYFENYVIKDYTKLYDEYDYYNNNIDDIITFIDFNNYDKELIDKLNEIKYMFTTQEKIFAIMTLIKGHNIEENNVFTSFNDNIIKLIKYIVESTGGICFLNTDEQTGLISIQPFFKRDIVKKIIFGNEDYCENLILEDTNDDKDINFYLRFCDVEPSRWITDIQYMGKTEMQCIMLDNKSTHTYPTDNFIITHNTTVGLQIASKIVEPYEEGSIIHFDFEQATSIARFKALSGWTDEMIADKYTRLKEGIYTETLYKFVKATAKIKLENFEDLKINSGEVDRNGDPLYYLPPTVVFVDSWALVVPKDISDEEELSGQMSATSIARVNNSVVKRLAQPCQTGNIIIIAINHITTKVDIGPVKTAKQLNYMGADETTPGGSSIIFMADALLKVTAGSKLEKDKDFGIKGFISTLEYLKSRSNEAGIKFEMVFDQARGFDNFYSNFNHLKKMKLLKGNGRAYYFDFDPDTKFTQKSAKEVYQKNKTWRKQFDELVADTLIDFLSNGYINEDYNENLEDNDDSEEVEFSEWYDEDEGIWIGTDGNYYDEEGEMIEFEDED